MVRRSLFCSLLSESIPSLSPLTPPTNKRMKTEEVYSVIPSSVSNRNGHKKFNIQRKTEREILTGEGQILCRCQRLYIHLSILVTTCRAGITVHVLPVRKLKLRRAGKFSKWQHWGSDPGLPDPKWGHNLPSDNWVTLSHGQHLISQP